MDETFIPIVFFLVVGACFIVYFYLRNREREMIIEKGLSSEQMLALYSKKKDPFLLLKIGIIIFFFGIGIGTGLYWQEIAYYEEAVAVTLFPCLGLGFIVAFFVARIFEVKDKEGQNS